MEAAVSRKKPSDGIKVSKATAEQLPEVLRMLRVFYGDAAASDLGEYDADHMTKLTINLMANDDSVVLVALNGSPKPVGMLLLFAMPAILRPDTTMVQEIAWYVEPNHRLQGAGRALLTAAMDWSRERGAKLLNMVALKGSPEVARVYVNNGFRLLESTYSRRL